MAAPVKLPKGYGPKLGLGSFASSFASGLGRGMDAATRQREEEEERKAREEAERKAKEEVERRAKEVNDVKAAIETQIATLTAYRKSLIHECVTGQRRIMESDAQRAAAQLRFDNPCPKG